MEHEVWSQVQEELEALSVIAAPGELEYDQEALQALHGAAGAASGAALVVELHVSGTVSGFRASAIASLTPTYPAHLPEITLRCTGHSRAQLEAHGATLRDFLQPLAGDVVLFSVYQWLQEQIPDWESDFEAHRAGVASNTSNPNVSAPDGVNAPASHVFMRQYIYFHHIYNTSKRRDIVGWADELRLCGFSVIGKPGLVCVEGPEAAVTDYVSRLRRLPWQKMQVKVTDRVEGLGGPDEVAACCAFPLLNELHTDTHGNRGNHANMGEVRAFLAQHGQEHVFTDLFGLAAP
ncbi:uncharacterized protein MONBRDRAFT_8082 [Monosiga brevicollis MX1]|uniref:RWD domain-containing protein n=1 Tax=Monosiga brevicollis TaxID=81824 RepID=A9UZ00_MONBE|nr:uncharacterized protein MONBRDRAFT_8082 [Monosiga brevicollis MX1]EDQ89547.1 predicted protein [Monosiga brevicollis MX1]|eukprot:XP_001745576.1 hypothetical protein [Monosiga brevicollis MX1]